MKKMRHCVTVVIAGCFLCCAAWAGYDEGKRAYDLGDFPQAIKQWQPMANKGDPRAQLSLAVMHLHGEGVARDPGKAVALLRDAVAQNDAAAQAVLGTLYVTTSYKYGGSPAEAAALIRKSADQGNPRGRFAMATCYDTGTGVAVDEAQAQKWYLKAGEADDPDILEALGHRFMAGTGSTPKDDKRAFEYTQRAAKLGQQKAQARLGMMYASGLGVAEDQKQASYWMRKYAEQGDGGTLTALGSRYFRGKGSNPDIVLAYAFVLLGHKYGNEQALELLGIFAKEMNAQQIEKAKSIAARWKLGSPLPESSK
jgi:uncharacterized protein